MCVCMLSAVQLPCAFRARAIKNNWQLNAHSGNKAARRVAWKRRHLMCPPLVTLSRLVGLTKSFGSDKMRDDDDDDVECHWLLGPQISESAAWVTSLRFSFVAAAAYGHESVRPRQECLKFVAWVFCFSLRLRYTGANNDPQIHRSGQQLRRISFWPWFIDQQSQLSQSGLGERPERLARPPQLHPVI